MPIPKIETNQKSISYKVKFVRKAITTAKADSASPKE